MTGDWSKGPIGTGEAAWLHGDANPHYLKVGSLAESWEYPEPGTMIYHIRQGVHWHDKPPVNGRELTVDDIVFSIMRVWEDPRSYVGTNYGKPSRGLTITTPEKWTVVMKCDPYDYGNIISALPDMVSIIPPEVIEAYGDMTDWRVSCGTGPFMLVDRVSGSSATLERNPNYWGKDPLHPENQLPYVDGVKILIIPDASTRMAALRTGKVDLVGGLSREDRDSLLMTHPELKGQRYLESAVPGIYMRLDKPELPFGDINVRRALSMAIDRETIVRDFYLGEGEWYNYPIMQMKEYINLYTPFEELPESAREIFEYHPEKAKELLAEAGYPDGFQTKVVCTSGYVDLLCIIKEYWADIGVDLEFDVREYGAYLSVLYGRGNEEMIIRFAAPPGGFYKRDIAFGPNSPFNPSYVVDARVTEAFEVIAENMEWNEPMVYKTFKEITPYILEQCWEIPVPSSYIYRMWQPWLKAYHGEFGIGFHNHPNFAKYTWLDQDLKEEMTGVR